MVSGDVVVSVSISGMIVGLVQKPSDAVGTFAFAKPVLITDVWYGSGGSVTVTGMIRMSFFCVAKYVQNMIRFSYYLAY